ncbi:MAG: hypothetical protein K0R08_1830 [Solimicrobium sp.]|jgi:putative SOS response-associated peptidase YedK|nr:hypothetical protein [Solimicrobium sp.]
MCVNFQPVTRQQLQSHFKAPIQTAAEWRTETWQDYAAPIMVGDENGRRSLLADYSMIPKRHLSNGIKRFTTMNARAETIGTLRSYSISWQQCHFCLVPMLAFFEPNYESGKAERWRISMTDESPFAVAGLYRIWSEPEGATSYSFTQITINADDHPLMRRFHKPNDEKRSLVIVPAKEYDDWLSCRNPEEARSFLSHFPADGMRAENSPKITHPVDGQKALV